MTRFDIPTDAGSVDHWQRSESEAGKGRCLSKYRIYVVDDSQAIVDLACQILSSTQEFEAVGFSNSVSVLSEFPAGDLDCVLADLRMPEVDGEQLHQVLSEYDPMLSVVIMSGHADVRTAVRLMEQGTFTLLEKPFTSHELISVVTRAADRTRERRSRQQTRVDEASRLASLTAEEREVMQCMVTGLPNKAIAANLEISPRTLDRRRQSVLQKLGVNSVPELAAIVARLNAPSD